MSARALGAVFTQSAQSGAALMTLLAIASYVWEQDGCAKVSIPKIAQRARLTKRCIKANLPKLVAAGELSIERGNGRGHITCYRITPPEKVHTIHPLAAERGNLTTRKGESPDINRGSHQLYSSRDLQECKRGKATAFHAQSKSKSQKDPDATARLRWLDVLVAAYPPHRCGNLPAARQWLGEHRPDEAARAAIMADLANWRASAEWMRDEQRFVPDISNFLKSLKYRAAPPGYHSPISIETCII